MTDHTDLKQLVALRMTNERRRATAHAERQRRRREAHERALAEMRVEIPGYSPIARLHPGAVRWRGSESAGWRGKGQN